MSARPWAIRLVLAMLALVALGAVAGAFAGSWRAFSYIAITGVVGCIGGVLAVPVAGWVDRPRIRTAAMVTLACIAIELALVLAAIWAPGYIMPEAVGVTALAFGGASVCIIFGSFARVMPGGRVASDLLLAGGAISFLLIMPAVWGRIVGVRLGDSVDNQFAVTGATLMGVTALVGMAAFRRQGEPLGSGVVALIASVAALILAIFLIWGYESQTRPDAETLVSILTLLLGVALATGLWRVSRFADLRGPQSYLRAGLAASAGGIAATAAFSIVDHSQQIALLSVSCAVVTACCALGISLFWRANHRAEFSVHHETLLPGIFPCPRCRQQIVVRPGRGTCTACGLSYRFELEAAKCRRCGQPVGQTTSERCSECGEPILLPPPPVLATPPA